jgi:prevent-host-death family protein
MRKRVGLFEAKTKLSELCEQVARTRQPVTVTRRGKELVRITPVEDEPSSILERRRAYMKLHARQERDDSEDFEPGARARDLADYDLSD